MNLTNIRRQVSFPIDNNIWSHVEVLVDERVSWNRNLRKIDTMFNDISVSVVDTVLPKWFFQFYRLY
jgi:hypothetical protein